MNFPEVVDYAGRGLPISGRAYLKVFPSGDELGFREAGG